MNHTEDFYRFYKEKMIYKDARPNKAHTELADMEESGKLKAVITRISTDCTNWRGAKTYWSFTVQFTGTTALAAAKVIAWIIS